MSTFPSYSGPQANPANSIALPFFALVGIIITYLPLRSFWSHRNVPLVSIVIANGIYNLWSFLNPIIWPNDDQALWWPGYGLCDIQVLLSYPIGIALAASLCALSKGLAVALDTENARLHQTKSTKHRKIISDVVFCWGIPVLQLVLHYVIQSGRYQIYPVYGCADVLDNSWPTIVIIMIWLPFFTFLNMYYAVLLLFRLRKHRRTISSALTSTGSGFAARKYIKLVLITLSLIVIYLPIQMVLFFKVLPTDLVSYSWSRVHDPTIWNPIEYFHTGDYPNIQYNGWAGVGVAFLLWAFFGFNDDAVDTYRLWMVKMGLAHFWPSLKNTREARRAMRNSRRGSSVTGVSLSSSLDLVGKVMKYFDGDLRRVSDGTTIVNRQSNK
ncbi:STE3-domain-containing protein [Acephala macrosclerotiorum]|nr:STE3-domain-containing protein [Acephala macrosclerotiorum]